MGFTVDDEQHEKLRQLLAQTPYSSSVEYLPVTDAESLLTYLGRLRDVLSQAGAEETQMWIELRQHRSLRGMQRWLLRQLSAEVGNPIEPPPAYDWPPPASEPTG